MIIALFLIAAVVVVMLAVPLVLRGAMRRATETDAEFRAHNGQTLGYVVPEGQDPVVLITALHHAGYPAVADPVGGEQRVLIGCPSGRESDRSGIRAVIEHVHTTGIDGVDLRVAHARFDDES